MDSQVSAVTIGNTECLNSLEYQEQITQRLVELETENRLLEEENQNLKQQKLTLKQENNDLRKRQLEKEECFETEREQYQHDLDTLQKQLDDSRNAMLDMSHLHNMQIIERDRKIRRLECEVHSLSSRLMNHENAERTGIGLKQTKRFRSSVLRECKRCRSVITDDDETACSYHPEKAIRAPMYTTKNQLMLWKCCYQVSKTEPPGCTSLDNHESDI